jgi:hypothetical protein
MNKCTRCNVEVLDANVGWIYVGGRMPTFWCKRCAKVLNLGTGDKNIGTMPTYEEAEQAIIAEPIKAEARKAERALNEKNTVTKTVKAPKTPKVPKAPKIPKLPKVAKAAAQIVEEKEKIKEIIEIKAVKIKPKKPVKK